MRARVPDWLREFRLIFGASTAASAAARRELLDFLSREPLPLASGINR